jgi:hypothetical protein
MKKIIFILATSLLLTGCSTGISKEKYESVSSAASMAEKEKESLAEDLAAISSEYSNYKESMAPYEELSEEEANAKKLTAESEAAQASIAMEESKPAIKAAEEASIAEVEASKAAEEAVGYETGFTYDQISRTPDDYNGKKVKFTGTVLQVIEDTTTLKLNNIRLAVNGDYNKVVYIQYSAGITDSRILENDKITIYGISSGLTSYTSTLGSKITIPMIYVEKIDQ